MKKLFFILTFAICLLQGSKADAQMQKAKFVELAPASDGFLDEWLDSDWIESTSERMQFQILHDDNFIYVAARIEDSTPASSNTILNTYDRDCLELYISMDTTVSTAYKAGCWQIRFQRKAEKQSLYVDGNSHRNTWSVAQLKATDNFVYGIQSEKTGWTTEVTLPYSTLSEKANFNKKFIRFAIRAVDNTTDTNNGPYLQSFWPNESNDLWQNPKGFAVIELAKKVEKEIETGFRLNKNVESFAFVSEQKLFTKKLSGSANIYGLDGRRLMSFEISDSPTDVSGLKPGLYVLRLKEWSQKILVK